MKRKISSTLLVALLISLTIILGSIRKVPAKVGCSNSSLHGSYGLHATGIAAAGGAFAAVGVVSFDGAGNLEGTLFVKLSGGISPVVPISGTYTVHPDCTVSDTFGGSQHTSVIVDNGRGYLINNTTAGDLSVISGEAHKQFRHDHDDDD
jgi:hypothetical protein